MESGDNDISSTLNKRIEKEFTQDMEIVTVIASEHPLATLHELDTVYSLSDLYDFLEIIAMQSAVRADMDKNKDK